jgi:hypothetical protein
MAAERPGKPYTPVYVSSTATTITIGWKDNQDNGGSLITAYKVYADTGSLTDNTFNYIDSTAELEFTLDKTVHTSYLSGEKYRFRITAVNVLGESEPSFEVRVLLASLPSKPAAPTIDRSRCTLTSLFV